MFDIDSACQGQEGLERVRKAQSEGRPYAMAFVDVLMPPGWDGIETIGQLAARIAHEINTPTQFIGDNLRFVRDGFRDLMELRPLERQLLGAARALPACKGLVEEFEKAYATAE